MPEAISTGGWVATKQGGDGWEPQGKPWMLAVLPPGAALATVALPAAPGVLAASYGWCEVMHSVDLVAVLTARGMRQQAACDWLDCAPAFYFEVW